MSKNAPKKLELVRSDRTGEKATTINVRETMRGLPLQALWTAWTGKPLHDESMLIHWTHWGRLAVTLLMLAGSVSGSVFLIHATAGWWLLLPAMWLCTVSAARSIQTSYVHHASHGNLFGIVWLDRVVAEFLSAIVWIQPLSLYARDHRFHHGRLATTDDPDLRFLVSIGLRPGFSLRGYWWQLFGLVISLRFHAMYLMARLRANFLEAPPLRLALSYAYTASLLLLAGMTGWWLELAVAWLIPILPLYQVAGLLQMLTEHHWVRIGQGVDSPKVVLAKLTSGRFMGEPTPQPNLPFVSRIVAWSRWWFRMVAVHGTARLFVVQMDLPNHDWHHRHPKGYWPATAYLRRDDELSGTPGWPPYQEFWGVSASLNATFELLSQLPPTAVLGDPLTYREKSDITLGM